MMRIVPLLLAALLSGCSVSAWRHAGSPDGRDAITPRLAQRIPVGWNYQWMGTETILMSRDGPAIQLAVSSFLPWEKRIVGDPDGQVLRESYLPTDIAEQILAARRRELEIEEIVLGAITPAEVAGLEGFRVEYEYRAGTAVSYLGVCYGALHDEGVHMLRLEAPAIYYYDRDLPEFERLVVSARLPTPQERKRAEDGYR